MENQSPSEISTLVHNDEFDLSDDNSSKEKHRFSSIKFSRKCIAISVIIGLIIVFIPVFYVISGYEYSGIGASAIRGHAGSSHMKGLSWNVMMLMKIQMDVVRYFRDVL